MDQTRRILITGGAGYVGAMLVPKLLKKGYQVRVLDLYFFGENIWDDLDDRSGLEEIKGDIRDEQTVSRAMKECDAVIHLACISNDPSCDLNPQLARTINFDCFEPMVKIAKAAGVRKFIFASSSSVYGVSDQKNVTEDHPLLPITDYNRFKGMCEPILLKEKSENFAPVVIRPATLCGYSRRQRLDLTVNILTNHAVNRRKILVFGGKQMRPNLHIQDMLSLYELLLELPAEKISGGVYNAGYENYTVEDLAKIVKRVVEKQIPGKAPIEIETTPSDDIRSYHISSEKIKRELGFVPHCTIEDAVRELTEAFAQNLLPHSLDDIKYFNIKTMQSLDPLLCPPPGWGRNKVGVN